MNAIPDETYTSALDALEKIKDPSLLNISFEEWFMTGDLKDDNTSEYNHKRLYLLLRQLKTLIDPLLIDITHIDHNDASDKYFLFVSRYFAVLLKEIEQMSYRTFTTPNDSHLMDILNMVDVPLTRYLQKRESDKRKIEDLLESVILALSDIESQYLFEKPEQIAVPLDDTKKILEPLNDFVKSYKRKIENDDFDMRVALGGLQRKLSNEDITANAPMSEKHSSRYYITKSGDDFYHDGNLIQMKKDNESYKIFSVLFEYTNEGGSIPYKQVYSLMKNIKGFERLNQSTLHKKMLRALTDNTNGFVKKSKIKHTAQKSLFTLEIDNKINFNNKRS